MSRGYLPPVLILVDDRRLRATAHRLAHNDPSFEVRTLARLAASYILAGDVETARRYLDQAERMVEERQPPPGE